jgi:predicted transcriptional regulator
MTDFIEQSFTKTTSHGMSIDKLTANHKKLKHTLLEQLHETKDRLNKESLETHSKIEIIKTKMNKELEHVKNGLGETLSAN